METRVFTLITFVPSSHREFVLSALFEAGAGRYKNYDHCAFVSSGRGRFRPLGGSKPFIGTQDRDELVEEERIETIVGDELVDLVLKALRKAHPYQEPAIYLYLLDSRCLG